MISIIYLKQVLAEDDPFNQDPTESPPVTINIDDYEIERILDKKTYKTQKRIKTQYFI